MGKLFEHITELNPDDFIDLEDASSTELLAAQAGTAGFFASLGAAEDVLTEDQRAIAHQAFAAVTNPEKTEAERKKALMMMRAPAPVKHLAGMLTEYDWQFVEQAKEIRGYVVAQLLEHATHPDPKIRLKSLQMLGNVTEVGAFTERVEVTKRNASSDELEARLREKIERLSAALRSVPPAAGEVQDVKEIR
jgi:hypothetical protein